MRRTNDHVLYSVLSDLVKNILNRFFMHEVVQNKEGGDLLTICINNYIMLPNDKIGIGESTKRLLQRDI